MKQRALPPLAWLRYSAKLLQQAKSIKVGPHLDNRTVDNLVDADARIRHLFACWRDAHHLTAVGATKRQPIGDLVAFCDRVLNLRGKIGKGGAVERDKL